MLRSSRGHEGHADAPPGPQQNGAQDIDHVLHRGALAAEHGEAEHAAHDAQRTEHSRESQLFHRDFFHLKFLPFQKAVETFWSPLTPEHGFPSHRFKAQGAPPSARSRPDAGGWTTKKAGDPLRHLLQKITHDDFLRRHYPHQVKGSKLKLLPLSPLHELPCVLFSRYILHPSGAKSKPGAFRFAFLPNHFYNPAHYVILMTNPAEPGGSPFPVLPCKRGVWAYGSCKSCHRGGLRRDGRPVERIFLL